MSNPARSGDSDEDHLRTTMTLTTASALVAVASVAAGGLAAAKPIDRGTIHEDLSHVLTNFCGVAGLDIDFDAAIDIEYTVGPRAARNCRTSHSSSWAPVRSPTRTTTAMSASRSTSSKRTCGSPTTATNSTLVVLVTGDGTVYGMDGKAIARNPGQVRDEILIDNNGTPQDPSDDEFLEFIQEIKGSTGRTDGFSLPPCRPSCNP